MSATATDTRGQYVGSIVVNDGRLEVTFSGPRAHQEINGETMFVTPYETDGKTIVWRCGKAGAPAGGTLLNGGVAHGSGGTVVARYLPRTCRP